MAVRREDSPAKKKDAASDATPSGQPAAEAGTDHNAAWDADEEPWRHPPVAPNDENPARSLGRSISDAVVSAADERKDSPPPKAKP